MTRAVTAALALVALVLPAGVWLLLPHVPALGSLERAPRSSRPGAGPRDAFQRHALGNDHPVPPWTTNTQLADLNRDGRLDIIVCDARFNRVYCLQQTAAGAWEEVLLGADLVAPAHATVVDLDDDGDQDVLVSVLGNIWPDDHRVGRVVLLEQTAGRFVPRVLLSDVRRVADVQPGDFDGDGDLDLTVAVFGYARGEVLWLENHGTYRFQPHTLLKAAGAIHVPVADYDGDGDLDIATTISQDDEEVWSFENVGAGTFVPRRLWFSWNHDLGSAGLIKADLDQDGDPDLLLPVGDNLEDVHSFPQAYHGCFWLENRGGWIFEARRIATLGGTYAAAVGDLDNDRDLDVALATLATGWEARNQPGLAWLENDGRQNFTLREISRQPAQLVTVGCGDVNGDGRDDIVTGSLSVTPPYERAPPVTLWFSGTANVPSPPAEIAP